MQRAFDLACESGYQPILRATRELLRRLLAYDDPEAAFAVLSHRLGSFPMVVEKRRLARLHLANAKSYGDRGEIGAAAWEIRALLMQLYAQLAIARSDFESAPADADRFYSDQEFSREPSALGDGTYGTTGRRRVGCCEGDLGSIYPTSCRFGSEALAVAAPESDR